MNNERALFRPTVAEVACVGQVQCMGIELRSPLEKGVSSRIRGKNSRTPEDT